MKKNIIVTIGLIVSGIVNVGLVLYLKNQVKVVKSGNEKYQKFKKYYQVLNMWIKMKQNDKKIEEGLLSLNLKSIAIYGNGEIGGRLYDELKDSNIKVSYFIDQMASDIPMENAEGLQVYGIDDLKKQEKVDAIIITTVNIADEIKNQLEEVTNNIEILSVEDLLIEGI